MTELKLSTAPEATKPVDKVVPVVRDEIKVPGVEVPKTDNNSTDKPVEVLKTEEKVAPAV